MSPCLSAGADCQARKQIRVNIDAPRYAELLSRVPRDGAELVDSFTRDGEFERLAACRDESGGRILHSALGECFLVSTPSGHEIELVAGADSGMMRRCLMRLVRELAMIQAMHRGDVFVHGAAVVCRGQAIIVSGAKRSGKTTMLLNALRQEHTRFLCNDRIFIQRNAAGFQAWGMPTIIAIRLGSFEHLPGFKLPEWGHSWRHYLTMRECEDRSPLMRPAFQDPPAMNPAQFCRWLGAEMVRQAPLRAMVFPRIDESVSTYALDRLGAEEGGEMLCSNVFWAGDRGPVAKAFSDGWEGAAPTLQSLQAGAREISKQCALFTCRIGSAAFGTPNVWEAIVSAVFDRQ